MDQINKLLSSLSPEDIDSLKSLANSLLGSAGQDTPAPEQPAQQTAAQPQPQSQPQSQPTIPAAADLLGNIDTEAIAKIGSIMGMLNSKSDDNRVALITALKPLLSEGRKSKADEALKIIRMMEILPILKKQGIF